MSAHLPIRRALISVSDKTGIVEFARQLKQLDIDILSTGGTARLLQESNIPVTEVADYTGFPEIMAGRVKTLHPKIHGGLLGRRGVDEQVMQEQGIAPIDLLIVNLYPFEQTIARDDCDLLLAIENIDIGGPAMLRAAAKNHAAVSVIVDSNDYDSVLTELRTSEHNALSAQTRFALAAKTFAYTARYDTAIANYLTSIQADTTEQLGFPNHFGIQFEKIQDLRYGENPHQKAAFYREPQTSEASIATAQQLQGKALSYNNIADSDAALECVKSFTQPACVIVKHANPCGVAVDVDINTAYRRAFQTDPTSAFGGIIAFNRELDKETAQLIIDKQFVEVIIAPTIADDALPILASKTNVRVLSCGQWPAEPTPALHYQRVNGGLLVQQRDSGSMTEQQLQTVSQRQPTEQQINDLLFAWNVAKFVKSNAIVYARDGMTIGIGAGQMSRVYSARIAAIKAADEDLVVQGAVLASDAFFPFRDGIDAAAEVGITAIIQPGGSVRDEEVIAAADEHDIAMVFTQMRHFRH